MALILAGLLWPFAGLVLTAILSAVGVKYMGLVLLAVLFVWLALFVWLFVRLWQTAKELGVTPWVTLWLLLPVFGLFFIGMLILEPLKYTADAKPAGRRLPLTWTLIKETWKFYARHFKVSLKTAIWYLYLFLGLGLVYALLNFLSPNLTKLWPYVLFLPSTLVGLWIMLNLLNRTALLEKDGSGSAKLVGLRTYLSFLWVTILTVLISMGPMIATFLIIASVWFVGGGLHLLSSGAASAGISPFGALSNPLTLVLFLALGSVLLIPSWLWLMYKSAIWNNLAMPVFLLDGKKGYAALKECDRLAKGRWWGLFWKNQLAGMVFGAYGMLISLGMSVTAILLSSLFRLLHAGQILTDFVGQGLNGVIQMVMMPLLAAFAIKLYQAFSKTAE